MTDEELAAIKARAEAATPGPWRYEQFTNSVYTGGAYGDFVAEVYVPRDGPLVAHAREDVPALLAEITALRAALADVLDTYPYELVSDEPPSHDKARALLAEKEPHQ